jgi:hypothetical protein
MKHILRLAISGAALATALVVAPGSAQALTTVYNPGTNGAYCVEAYSYINGVTPDGHSLQFMGYADASLWNNGGCDGDAAGENTVIMHAELQWSPDNGNDYQPVYAVPTTGSDSYWEYNTYDLWGVYIATLENQSPLGGVTLVDGNLPTGDGWYRLRVTSYVLAGNGWNGGTIYSAPQYIRFTYP